MKGFNPSQVSTILDLPSSLVPVVYLAVGKEASEDGAYPRFRFSETDLVTTLS